MRARERNETCTGSLARGERAMEVGNVLLDLIHDSANKPARITTHLGHVSQFQILSGTHWSNRGTYRVSIVDTGRYSPLSNRSEIVGCCFECRIVDENEEDIAKKSERFCAEDTPTIQHISHSRLKQNL